MGSRSLGTSTSARAKPKSDCTAAAQLFCFPLVFQGYFRATCSRLEGRIRFWWELALQGGEKTSCASGESSRCPRRARRRSASAAPRPRWRALPRLPRGAPAAPLSPAAPAIIPAAPLSPAAAGASPPYAGLCRCGRVSRSSGGLFIAHRPGVCFARVVWKGRTAPLARQWKKTVPQFMQQHRCGAGRRTLPRNFRRQMKLRHSLWNVKYFTTEEEDKNILHKLWLPDV